MNTQQDPMSQALEMAHVAHELSDAFAQTAQSEVRFDAFDSELSKLPSKDAR